MFPAAIRLDRLCLLAGLLWLSACFSTPGATDSTWFTRVWQTDDGLPDNNVQAIVQGRDNYLWLVTPAGLTRFDGVSFSRFPIQDLTGTSDVHIKMFSRTGVLWMVSDDGTVMGLKPDFSTVTLPQAGLPTHAPVTLAEEADGSLWLGYFGSAWAGYTSAIYRIKNGLVQQFTTQQGVPSGTFRALTTDGAGNIWLAKANQVSVFRNGKFDRVATTADVQCMGGARGNAVWWTTAAGRLVRCETNGMIQDCGAFESPPGTARNLLEDRTGAVWIGTDGNGLIRYSQSGFEKVETSHASISSLAEDREGNLWVGTAGGGLDRVSLSGARLEPSNPVLGQIQSLCEDASGRLWGVTHNGALVSRVNGQWTALFTNESFAGNAMYVAADREGAVWVGTRDQRLVRIVDANCTVAAQNSTATHLSFFALLPTSQGDLWIVNRHALLRLQDGQLQETSLPRQIQRFSAIAEDAAGNVWVGAKGVVMRFDGTNFVDETPHLPVSDRDINCFYAGQDGSLWISCGGLGLLRLKAGHLDQIGVDQGLYDDDLSQIVADGRGWLWFGSGHGIFKVRQLDLEQAMADHRVHLRPIVYGRNEGLASLEAVFSTTPPYVLPRAMVARNGQVCLLTHAGLVMADPEVLSENSAPPPALLTRVAMDGQTIAVYGPVVSTQTAANLKTMRAPLRLPPGHRHLEFDFTAIQLRMPENVRFRYQLTGFENDWIDAETRRSADYSRLAAGDYQFRVEASLGDGPWNETAATLAFTVAPFVWQTWWFRLGALLLFTSAVIAVARYVSTRRLQAKLRQVEQRAALDKERTRIARDLHDELGCNLNWMALTLDMMQREGETRASANGKIRHFSAMVREAAQCVDEIVWAINPRNDTLRYMVDYISQFAVEFMQAADILCLVELPDNVPDRVVSPEVRHNLLLVVKEALNNVTRHARASEVWLRVTLADNQLAISIEDNGRGFERLPDNASSDGLRNMRQRMTEIGGQIQLASQPGAGTRVAFLYPWPPNR